MITTAPTSDLSTFLGSDPGLERLYDNVQAEVPMVGLAAVKMATWNTIEEFYIRSTCRREHVFWSMPNGVHAVDFNPFDADWLVAWVLSYCGPIQGKVEPPGLLRDIQFPLSTSLRQGEAWVALKPASLDSDCGPLLFQQWFETILSGVLSRLYRQPAKPFSSPQLAQSHGRVFTSGIGTARGIADRSFANDGGRWRFPYFAAGRRKN